MDFILIEKILSTEAKLGNMYSKLVLQLRKYCIDNNLQQKELAQKLGLSAQYTSEILRKKKPITLSVLDKIKQL